MNEQVPADELPDPFYNRADNTWELTPDQWRKVCDLVTDLRASLIREQNARKIAVKDADRYRWLRRQDGAIANRLVEDHMLEGLDLAIDEAMGKRS